MDEDWIASVRAEHLEHFGNGAVPSGDPRKWDLIIEMSRSMGYGTPRTPNFDLPKKFLGEGWSVGHLGGRRFGVPGVPGVPGWPMRSLMRIRASG